MGLIYHITKKENWLLAQDQGCLTEDSLIDEGFIHCSFLEQVVNVANHIYKGQTDLILMVIDDAKISVQIRVEDLYHLNEKYPHIYGKINLDAVIMKIDFQPDQEGKFSLPREIMSLHS